MSTQRLCLLVERWPAVDRDLWRAGIAPAALFEPAGAGASWSARTRDKFERDYGRWLAWLRDQGLLDAAQPPAARVTRDRVAAYLRDLERTCSPHTLTGRVQGLRDALRVLAPDGDWAWLTGAKNALRRRAEPIHDKRARLRSPNELIGLGQDLMAQADSALDWSAQRRAVHFRDGLAIALLACRPVRMRNLASMRIGKHLVNQRDRYWIVFRPEETKAGQPFEAPFPDDLVPALARYLDHHRPVLLMGENRAEPASLDALWVSEVATQLEQGAMGRRIIKHTKRAFGASVPPHWFRDAVATEIAIHNPRFVDDARHMLGHATPTTTEKFYNQAQTLQASRRYHQLVAARRHEPSRVKTGQGDDE